MRGNSDVVCVASYLCIRRNVCIGSGIIWNADNSGDIGCSVNKGRKIRDRRRANDKLEVFKGSTVSEAVLKISNCCIIVKQSCWNGRQSLLPAYCGKEKAYHCLLRPRQTTTGSGR